MNIWSVVTALDIFSELAAMAIPAYTVSTVLIALSPTILAITAFASRLGWVPRMNILRYG